MVNQLITQITPRSLIEQSLEQSVSNKAVVTDEAVDRYWEMLRYPGNRQATLDRFGTQRVPFEEADVAAVEVPALIIWGEEDTLIPFAAAAWFENALPNATSVSYAGIGHLPMEEAPDRTAADLREWLANLQLGTDLQ
ncbi:alpha/beta hydrolase [Sphingomonadaceae bacterium]|nr:alpha/beta hydrolase [Sphingomonadaceae bacterium]